MSAARRGRPIRALHLLVWGLVACHKEVVPDSEETGVPVEQCADVDAPTLSTTQWAPTGDMPAGGILSLVSGPSGVPLYAASHNSGLWSSQDSGDTWTRSLVTVTHTLADLAVSPDDPLIVYRSSGGVLERTEDGGRTWLPLALGYVSPSGAESVFALAVAPYDAQRIYGVVDSGQTYVSDDGGASFVPTGRIPVELSMGGMDPFNTHAWRLLPDVEPDGRLLFTDGMAFYVSDDGMQTWQSRFASTLGGHSLQRDPSNRDHLLVGATDGLLESFDHGDTWALRDIGTGIELGAFSEDGTWLAYASADTLYVSEDNGGSFVARPFDWIQNDAILIGGDRIVMSWDDGVVVSDDHGQTWAPRYEGLIDPGMAIVAPHPVCPNRVYTGSRCSGGVYLSDDYGTEWTHVDTYFHYVMGIHFDPQDPDTIWAVSDDSLIVSRDGGTSWADAFVKYHFHGFAVDPADSDTLLLGSVGSGTWNDTSMHVYRSVDGAQNWVDSSAGLPTSQASAHTIAYWPDNPDVVILGTYKGDDPSHVSGDGIGAFRSEDGGQTWALTSLPAINIAWLAPCPGGVVATTEDGLWRSLDEGLTWQRLDGPDGFLLSADFHGELGLTLAQDGRVWRTDDGGDTWIALDAGLATNPTSFLAQIAIAADGATAWATVFEHGVYRIGLDPP